MGKVKTAKSTRVRRVDPIRSGSLSNPSPLHISDTDSIPLLDKLSGALAMDRSWAAAAISNLIDNPETLQLLLRKGVLSKLMIGLLDKELEVQMEMAGAIRNLMVLGGSIVIERMEATGILDLIGKLVKQISSNLTDVLKPKERESDNSLPLSTIETSSLPTPLNSPTPPVVLSSVMDPRLLLTLTEQILSILWILAEHSEEVTSSLTDSSLVQFLIGFLSSPFLSETSSNQATPSPSLVSSSSPSSSSVSNPSHITHEDIQKSVPHFILPILSLQILNTLSDSNPAMISLLSPYFPLLLQIMSPCEPSLHKDSSILTLQVLGAGILWNFRDSFQDLNFSLEDYLTILSRGLTFTPWLESRRSICLSLESEVIRLESLASSNSSTSKSDSASELTQINDTLASQVESFESKLSTLQLSLELISQFCTDLDSGSLEDVEDVVTEDESGEWEDIGNGDVGMEEEDGDTSMVSSQIVSETPTRSFPLSKSNSFSLSNLILSHQLLSQVHSLIFFSDEKAKEIPLSSPYSKSLMEAESLVSLRVTECLNNLFSVLPLPLVGDYYVESGQKVWNSLCLLLSHLLTTLPTNDSSEDFSMTDLKLPKEDQIESCLNTLWTVLRGRNGSSPLKNFQYLLPTSIQLNFLMSLGSHDLSSIRIQVQIVGILGLLGKQQNNIPQNRVIGNYLMNTLKSVISLDESFLTESHLDLCNESLNSFFDIYADEGFDYDFPVFVADKMGGTIFTMRPALKSKLQSLCKKKSKVIRQRTQESLINLDAFLSYKKEYSPGCI